MTTQKDIASLQLPLGLAAADTGCDGTRALATFTRDLHVNDKRENAGGAIWESRRDEATPIGEAISR